MLKMTGVKLEKILDIEMHLFIEKGLRGGISYIAKRYAKANNKGMENYDPTKPSKFITYVDMNNLYGWTIGYNLEVDLEYLDELHVLHDEYPLTREKLAIPYDMLSDYCKKIADNYEIKVDDVKKIIPNLGNKTNYVLYFKNLQL